MKLTLRRFYQSNVCTFSLLLIDGKFECFALEDIFRKEKVMHETRIPAGTYNLSIANWGDMNSRYLAKFGKDLHKGMIMLDNVPNFTGILIHMGNNAGHSSGCILVGRGAFLPTNSIDASEAAYKSLYAKVLPDIQKKTASIEIIDEASFS